MEKQIFVNLPVKDLNKTMEFFTKLGFRFNPKFTDEKAACMVIEKNIFAMLVKEKFFRTFIPDKKICKASKNTEVLVAISLDSREEVDKMIENVIIAGGKEYRQASDYGWMYSRSFQDIDGHIWEIMHGDESKFEEGKNKK